MEITSLQGVLRDVFSRTEGVGPNLGKAGFD